MRLAATTGRNFRTFLLMSQFAAQEIGTRIALARELAGLTQEELAAMTSFSKRSLQDYEAGVRTPFKHLQELSGLLRRPVEWFLHGDAPAASDLVGRLEALEAQSARIEEVASQGFRETREGIRSLLASVESLEASVGDVDGRLSELEQRRRPPGSATQG